MTTLGVDRDDFYPITNVLPQTVYNASTANLNGTVLPGNLLVGAKQVYFQASGQTTAQGITLDSAVNIVFYHLQQMTIANKGSSVPGVTGGWVFRLWNANTTSGAITLTAGTGVVIVGSNTVAIGATRSWLVTVTAPTIITFQDLGSYATT